MDNNQQLIAQKFGSDAVIASHGKEPQPLVSIIIPTYNCLEYLPRAIQSIQSQGVNELEILIIDDNSKDNTWAYLTLACLCDPRIVPIKGQGGCVSTARNKGINTAKGRLVAFLDADDYWTEGKLQRQVNFHLDNPKATMSFTNYLHVDEQDTDLGDCFGYWPRFSKFVNRLSTQKGPSTGTSSKNYHLLDKTGLGKVYAENVIGTSTVMLDRNNLKWPVLFDTKLRSAEDWDYWLNCAKQGPIGFTSNIDMIYLMRKNSESSKVEIRLEYMYFIMRRHYKAVLSKNPLALFPSLSRLITGHAELQRSKTDKAPFLKRKFQSIKAGCLHFTAFIISPSNRGFRAMLADIKHLLTT